MPDWALFRERIKQGDGRFQILARIGEMEPWLDLPWGQALIKAQETYTGLTAEQLRPVFQALPLIRLKLLRDAGITGSDQELTQRIYSLFAAWRVGRGSEHDRQLALRLANAFQIGWWIAQIQPSLIRPVTAESAAADKALVDSVGVLFPRFSAVMKKSHAGAALDENISELLFIKKQFERIAETASTDFQRKFISDNLARAQFWLAQNYELSKEVEEGQAAYRAAADWFEKAGAPDEAADCRQRAQDVVTGSTADTDEALRGSLRALTEDALENPLDRALALVANVDALSAAGDHFERRRVAEQMLSEFKKLELLDPQDGGFDAAVDSWIRNVPSSNSGTTFFRAFLDVHRCYLSILSSRVTPPDPDHRRSDQAFRLVLADKAESDERDIPAEASRQAAQAYAEIAAAWAVYFPQHTPSTDAPQPTPEQAEPTSFNRASSLLELAWSDMRSESENRDASDSQEDLISRAVDLERQASALSLPYFDAKAKLAHADVLINAGRPQDAIPLLDEARTLITSANPTTYGRFAGHIERGLYEMILRSKCIAQAMAADVEGWSDTCEEAIRSIECQRYLVNSPERQNAFLDWRADFYRFGVAAARKLSRWDQMLERMELIKARSVIRSRLLPTAPELDRSALAQQFRDVCDRLRNEQNEQRRSDLAAQRRQLWDLLSIARARQRLTAEPPEITVSNLQRSLTDDDAILGYFWQTQNVLLAIVISKGDFKLERIEFTADELAAFSEFIDAIQTLESFNGEMDWVVADLSRKLVPMAVREVIGNKRRLIISPHHTLHLFPFQAATWNGTFFGQRFAISYTPNLSSLLLPWAGAGENRLLVVGIRDFSAAPFNTKPLPLAESEAQAVAQSHKSHGAEVVSMPGKEASRSRFLSLRDENEFSRFRCVHLATHGTSVFQGDTLDNPMESRLIVYDGWLDGLEIADLNLQADLIVLSACNSGQRAIRGRGLRELPGDDIFGLQSALFRSGVRGVLGALWPLEDEPAHELMTRFHGAFAAGKPADEALQDAVNRYLDTSSRRDVYCWAGFFLTTVGAKPNSDKARTCQN
jgi:CHAT domain-containing protein